eukprot:2380091-Prymnesium_polylepis.1
MAVTTAARRAGARWWRGKRSSTPVRRAPPPGWLERLARTVAHSDAAPSGLSTPEAARRTLFALAQQPLGPVFALAQPLGPVFALAHAPWTPFRTRTRAWRALGPRRQPRG